MNALEATPAGETETGCAASVTGLWRRTGNAVHLRASAVTHTHFWLEMTKRGEVIIAVCQGCKSRGEFGSFDWASLAVAGQAKNRPVRL